MSGYMGRIRLKIKFSWWNRNGQYVQILLTTGHTSFFFLIKKRPAPQTLPRVYLCVSPRIAIHIERLDSGQRRPSCGRPCNPTCLQPSPCHCRRYDHHCDWIDNCVGHVNHKLFFLFLFYINLTILHHAYLVVSLLSSIEKTSAHTHTYFWAIHAVLVCLYTMVTFPLSCFGFGFLLWCTYLIVTNQTSLENELNTNYDVGFVQNCSEVLGDNFLTWFWPSPRQLTLAMVTESRAV